DDAAARGELHGPLLEGQLAALFADAVGLRLDRIDRPRPIVLARRAEDARELSIDLDVTAARVTSDGHADGRRVEHRLELAHGRAERGILRLQELLALAHVLTGTLEHAVQLRDLVDAPALGRRGHLPG